MSAGQGYSRRSRDLFGRGGTSFVALGTTYPVGSLVRFRGREWVVESSDDPELLELRPLHGMDEERCAVYLPLEGSEVRPASFPLPDPASAGDFVSGRLLRDATRLLMRNGAGPFRSFGKLSVRPRPYQLVPVILALRLDPVRLLIADDVGVGKTIEAGLIAKEMLERGDARRLLVLCPPYLCEQWQRELAEKFHIDAVVVRTSTLGQLERRLPRITDSVYSYYPHLIVSIDFAKGDHQKAALLANLPDLVILDEAHQAARPPARRQRSQHERHELVRAIADRGGHFVLLTATPHSGFQESFASLLGLLDPDLERMALGEMGEHERARIARHFVQRRRADVARWLGETTPFPERRSREVGYELSPEYRALLDDVWRFTRQIVRVPGLARRQQRVRYWAALSLLRSVMSSPAAAVDALEHRELALQAGSAEDELDEESLEALRRREVLDVLNEEAVLDAAPEEPVAEGARAMSGSERDRLRSFLRRARDLGGPQSDRKLAKLIQEVRRLLEGGYHPIVWCRFIATARYVAEELSRAFPRVQVTHVTSEMGDEERAVRVRELGRVEPRILVATDCLSEGIDLQSAFDAVVHYDLPWNPNRLEQREGRVDRYGQARKEVEAVLLYGSDNPVDLAVLDVLIRKAREIRRVLGITVPVPVESEEIIDALINALFLSERRPEQLSLLPDVRDVHMAWDRAAERERESRSRFAQHGIQPGEVAAELEKTDEVLGRPEDIRRFVIDAARRLDAPFHLDERGQVWADIGNLPPPLRLGQADSARVPVAFEGPAPDEAVVVGRNHPWIDWLAERALGRALEGSPDVARSGAVVTGSVRYRTVVLLLHLRYRLRQPGRPDLFAEEVVVTGLERSGGRDIWFEPGDPKLLHLLEEARPETNISPAEREEQVRWALEHVGKHREQLDAIARRRAAEVAQAHQRVRRLTAERPRVEAEAYPPDLLGLYVLLPGGERA